MYPFRVGSFTSVWTNYWPKGRGIAFFYSDETNKA